MQVTPVGARRQTARSPTLRVRSKQPPMKPHAFVAMPFGTKPGPDNVPVDFNRVYQELIVPALEAAGLEVFRADQEQRAGDILADMFQELLVADLVVADLTIDNPNVWYELGARHALRARGVVLICGVRATTAFDVYTDRKLRYGLKDGAPDPATLEADRKALADMVRATMESWHGRLLSPVYQLMPNLQEPEWKALRVGGVKEFWDQYDSWAQRVELARRANRIGDLLVLAGEAPVAALRAEAWIRAGKALRDAERFRFALEHLDKGLEIAPQNLMGLREKGICLQRLAIAAEPGHSLDRARAHYRTVLEAFPKDVETEALLARVEKDAWVAAWRPTDDQGRPTHTSEQMREDAGYEEALLRAAIEGYAKGYRDAPGHYYSGINALTLMHLYRHLSGDGRYDAQDATMAGAVRFAAQCAFETGHDYWSGVTLGDLEVLVGTPKTVQQAYRDAIACDDRAWFDLSSSRAQLSMLKDLGFSPDNVDAGLAAFDRAISRLSPPQAQWQPRQVLLFGGHMIDAPGRTSPRFPIDKEAVAEQRIAAALDQLGAGSQDLALTQAAAGADLLFLEACLARGVRCQVQLPFEEPEFIRRSIEPSVSGARSWTDRFYAVKAQLTSPPRIMTDELGPLPNGIDPFERCNLWLLYTALACGVDKVRFVCLWNGGGSDGPGGTAHIYNEVKARTGHVTWIDARTL
jgi:tetratricopeptide (TPR) repeat protein